MFGFGSGEKTSNNPFQTTTYTTKLVSLPSQLSRNQNETTMKSSKGSSTGKFGAQRFGSVSKGAESTLRPTLQMTLSAFKDKYAVRGSSKQNPPPVTQQETASLGNFSQNNDGASDQILDTTHNFGFTHSGAFDVTFKNKFQPLSPVKRRSPDQYIKNPTKVFGMTYGKKDFLWLDTAKESMIASHDNTAVSDKSQMLPPAPRMDPNRKFYGQVKQVLQANESVLTLGGTVRSLTRRDADTAKTSSQGFGAKALPPMTQAPEAAL